MKTILFVINPRSGRAQIRNHVMEILSIFSKEGYETRVHITQRPLHALEIVKDYGNDADLIVCSGGDGTLNETISGLVQLDNPPPLGYIPAGSTNDFASSLHIPKNMIAAAETTMKGILYGIDIGCFCNDRYFVYIAAFGAFTEVSYLTPQEKKNLLGHQAYMLEGVRSLMSLKAYHIKIEYEEGEIEGDFVFGMVTNTISVGGFKGLVKQDVSLNDGEFEVLLIRMPKTPMELSNILSCMLLKEEKNEYVYKFKTRSLRVCSEEPIDWVLDGEFGGSKTEVTIQNLQERIKIMRSYTKK